MKKIFFTFVCVFLLLSAFLLTADAATYSTGKYLVTSNAVTILESASIFSDKKGEIAKNTYIEITEIKGSFGYCTLESSGISGWVFLEGLDAVSQNSSSDIKKIEITSLPQTVYTEDEDAFNSTGLKVSAVYSDGTKKEISGYDIFCPSFSSYGTKTVTVRYSPANSTQSFTTTFNVTVNKVPLKSLSVSSLPAKTTYMENHPLDLTGLVLKAAYSDGRADRYFTLDEMLKDSDFTFSITNGTLLSPDMKTVNISYKYSDITTSFNISVTKKTLTNLSIKKYPNSMTLYYNTLIPTLDGMLLEAAFDNGEVIELTPGMCKIICTPSEFIVGEGNKVVVQYGHLSVTLNMRYTPLEAVGITLSLPTVLTFIKGEEVDLSELKVYLEYNSGKLEQVTDYTISEIDNLKTGTQNVVVKYKEFSEVFSVFVTAVFSKGDVSGDGNIKAEDARTILRAAVKIITLEGKRFMAGDINRDGQITAADARLALRAAVKLEDFFKK